jgi:ferritin-like metal-binding protein YciE
MAAQLGESDVAQLLGLTLADEEVADNLLTQIARALVGESRRGEPRAAKGTRTRARK